MKEAKQTNLVPEDTSAVTLEALQATMPKRQQHNVTQELVDKLNKIVTDPEERIHFRENLLSYTHVLQDPNIKLESYIHAVRYVSYKLMGMTNQDAWIKTFPDRYQRIVDDGKSAGHLRATVSGYNKNKIVATVYEQALIPVHVLNADVFQNAVKVQGELMIDPTVSPMVRSNAANSLLTHLKAPESKKIELDVTTKDDDSLRDLRKAAQELVEAQKKVIEEGSGSALDIAESVIIEGEAERVE